MSVKKDPFSTPLDEYEKDLETNLDKSKPLRGKRRDEILHKLKQAADNYLHKGKRITIRVYPYDLERIKMLAVEEGLPYQTLITSVLHKFAAGKLRSFNKNL